MSSISLKLVIKPLSSCSEKKINILNISRHWHYQKYSKKLFLTIESPPQSLEIFLSSRNFKFRESNYKSSWFDKEDFPFSSQLFHCSINYFNRKLLLRFNSCREGRRRKKILETFYLTNLISLFQSRSSLVSPLQKLYGSLTMQDEQNNGKKRTAIQLHCVVNKKL